LTDFLALPPLLGVWPPRLGRIATLRPILGVDSTLNPARWADAGAYAGWGRKVTSLPLRMLAQQSGKPFFALEDGFVRSMRPGAGAPLSLAVDDQGIYYDATRPSRLEALISQPFANLAQEQRAGELLKSIVSGRVTKYNHGALQAPSELPRVKTRKRVLVVDQTRGDLSVRCGMADASSFARMLQATLDDHPGAEVWVKVHPEVVQGRKAGYLAVGVLPAGVQRLAAAVNPYVLLEQFDAVYTVSSQFGFEALLAGLPVHVFGAPFYAGWGLTQDALDLRALLPRRAARPSLARMFDAAYLQYCRYLNPVNHTQGCLEDVLAWMELQRTTQRRFAPLGAVTAVGLSRWKHPFIRPYLAAGGDQPAFVGDAADIAPSTQTVTVWGARQVSAGLKTPLVRVEDGFVRSVGLGSDLIAPRSIVVDTRGIYFDARQTNDLIELLNHHDFDASLLERAAALRRLVCESGLTKYNLKRRVPDWQPPQGRCVVLVPGQVADDAAVQFGTGALKTVEALLQEVRRWRPEAFIVYKPHPDVLSGNRQGLVDAAALCDRVDKDADILSLIEVSDEVHTLCSLAGFDALLRGKRVVTYGMPFYAGWGLTEDSISPQPFRQRPVSLNALVAAALLLYPVYYDWVLGGFTTAEGTIHGLMRELALVKGGSEQGRQAGRRLTKAARWIRNVGKVGDKDRWI
jgi:capsular polysaccharide export protein